MLDQLNVPEGGSSRQNRWVRLFLVSFVALALEVLLIRWVASEIRVFAYFKNLILMACFLGLGVGCSTAERQETGKQGGAPGIWFPLILTVLVALVSTACWSGLSNISLLVDRDVFDWNGNVSSSAVLAGNVFWIATVFVLVVATFDAFGRQLGRELSGLPPLPAYSVNIAGSLGGVAAFSAMSFMQLPPTVWLAVCLLPLLPIYWSHRRQLVIFASCTALCLGMAFESTRMSLWSPYYRLDLKPLTWWLKDKSQIHVPYQLGTIVEVNHNQHQRTVDLSSSFIDSHPELKESNELRTYDLPYAACQKPGTVLVVGAGTGNDVAAALRHNAGRVDAVEIDPAIVKLGRSIHPEKPYDDKRVRVFLGDARAFLASCPDKYDLIQFGHLDSQTALSTMSSVRLDNYLYTRESISAATKHLSARGIASLSFATQPDWLRARLYQMVKEEGGGELLAFNTSFDAPNAILIIWGPGLAGCAEELSKKYSDILAEPSSLMTPVEIPTDDWPFLYQRARNLPVVSLSTLLLVLVISALLIQSRFRLRGGTFAENLQFFLLGAGFLLLETRAMLAVAILFGSTWIVNSIIISLVLLMALIANFFVMRQKAFGEGLAYVLLTIALLFMYFCPLSNFVGQEMLVKLLAAGLLLGVPFFFTGTIFARAFSRVRQPEVALGINILGAILGGCLEYLSVVFGANGLVLLALMVYLASWGAAQFRGQQDLTGGLGE